MPLKRLSLEFCLIESSGLGARYCFVREDYKSLLTFQIEGPYTLKYFLSMAGPDVISVGSCGEAQRVLKRVEREASHRYQTLTLPEDGAANCLYVNGTLIHRSRDEAPKSDAVRDQPLKPYDPLESLNVADVVSVTAS